MNQNFWKLEGSTLFTIPYVYVDHRSMFAKQRFEQEKLHVRFTGEMYKPDTPYCIVFCKVRKKDMKRFEQVLEGLTDRMLLLGHADYENVCEEIDVLFDQGLTEEETA